MATGMNPATGGMSDTDFPMYVGSLILCNKVDQTITGKIKYNSYANIGALDQYSETPSQWSRLNASMYASMDLKAQDCWDAKQQLSQYFNYTIVNEVANVTVFIGEDVVHFPYSFNASHANEVVNIDLIADNGQNYLVSQSAQQ